MKVNFFILDYFKFKNIILSLIIVLFMAKISFAEPVLSIPSFKNTTQKENIGWLEIAMSDMILTDMASIEKIKIVQRSELNKILKEQSLQLSGAVDTNTAIKIGSLTGANIILIGDFIFLDEKTIRFNASIFDVEKGTSLGAATVTGNFKELLKLEKLLVVKIFEALHIQLTDIDKEKIYQMPSESIVAIENNYRGIVAIEADKKQEAKTYFKKAVDTDPYYADAKKNFDKVSAELSGELLFSDATNKLDDKSSQLETTKQLTEFIAQNLYTVKIGKSEIASTDEKNDTADIETKIYIDYDPKTIDKMYETLNSSIYNNGDQGFICFYKSDKGRKEKIWVNMYKKSENAWASYSHIIESSGGNSSDKYIKLHAHKSTYDQLNFYIFIQKLVFTIYDSDNKPVKECSAYIFTHKNNDDEKNPDYNGVFGFRHKLMFLPEVRYNEENKTLVGYKPVYGFDEIQKNTKILFIDVPLSEVRNLKSVKLTQRYYIKDGQEIEF